MDDYDTILGRMKTTFSGLAGYSPDDASDLGIRMKVLAGEIWSIQNAVDWLKRESFAQTATGAQLDLLAQEKGLVRKQPAKAGGMLTFSVPATLWFSATVPAGTVCATGGSSPVRYVTTVTTLLPQGSLSVDVPAEAQDAGTAGNMTAGKITVLVTPPASITVVTNAAAFTGGEDAEDDGALRERLLAACAEVSTGCNAAWYRETATAVPGIDSANVVPRANGAGTVAVYLGGQGCAPSSVIVSQVQQKLAALREIDVDVTVSAAQTVPVDVTASVKQLAGFTAVDVKSACVAAIQSYFLGLGVGEPVVISAIDAQLFQTGMVADCTFSTVGKSVSANQLAVCGGVSVTVGA